jgi:hypothetical protein
MSTRKTRLRARPLARPFAGMDLMSVAVSIAKIPQSSADSQRDKSAFLKKSAGIVHKSTL